MPPGTRSRQPALNAAQRAIGAIARTPALRAPRQAAMRSLRLTWGTPLPVLAKRNDLPLLLNRRGLTGRGAEVGVKAGAFSELLLELWDGDELISIDPWAEAAPDEYVDLDNVPQDEHDALHAQTAARLARFGARSAIWRMTGEEAARRIAPASLDFVYLDARHDRASVGEDLRQWLPRVRAGGILAGHDYVDGSFANGEFGVRSAVDSFFGTRSLRVRSTFTDQPWVSWFVVVR
jgi:hypothetical protein